MGTSNLNVVTPATEGDTNPKSINEAYEEYKAFR